MSGEWEYLVVTSDLCIGRAERYSDAAHIAVEHNRTCRRCDWAKVIRVEK